jgi:uncharacterized protein (DUF2252 family)
MEFHAMPTPPLPPDERIAHGRAARKKFSRKAQAGFSLKAAAHDPMALLRASEKNRIQSLLPIKHQHMLDSCFGFYRGSVPIMAADLAELPNTGLYTQLCGDAHISNLGAYCAPDGRLTFDINDFDETIRGPFEYDVKRLATSLILGGREAGIKQAARQKAVMHFLQRYRLMMHSFANMRVLELTRYQIHRLAQTPPIPEILEQSERATTLRTLKNLTEPATPAKKTGVLKRADGSESKALLQGSIDKFRIFKSEPPLLRRVTGKERELVLASLGPYSRTLQPERRHFLNQYQPVDVAFKVVGTGSVGLYDYIVYLEGTHSTDADPLFLQIKEEPASAYTPYHPEGDQHAHQGHRVMDGQRAMQLTSDPFLGYTTIDGRDYLVRQLNDHKASLDLDALNSDSLLGYADLCGELFARGHARAGDPVAMAAYLGTSSRFDNAIFSFAHDYADQTERYWKIFKQAFKPEAKAKAPASTMTTKGRKAKPVKRQVAKKTASKPRS